MFLFLWISFDLSQSVTTVLIAFNKTGTSKVGAISKAQKAQKTFFEKNFQKMSHSAEKCKRGEPLLTYILLQNIKKLERGTLLRH